MPVKIQLAAQNPLALTADLVVLPVSAGANVKQEPLASVDKALSGGLSKLIAAEEFKGNKDQSLDFPARRSVLGEAPASRYRSARSDEQRRLARLRRQVSACGQWGEGKSLVLGLPDGFAPDKLRYVAEGLVLGAYRFDKYFTGDRRPKAEIASVTDRAGSRGPHRARRINKAVLVGQGVARAVALTRDLVNEPPNELYPALLASEAQAYGQRGWAQVPSVRPQRDREARDEAPHRGRTRQRQRAALRSHQLHAQASQEKADLRRQGAYFRLRRSLHQACRRNGRDEERHGGAANVVA